MSVALSFREHSQDAKSLQDDFKMPLLLVFFPKKQATKLSLVRGVSIAKKTVNSLLLIVPESAWVEGGCLAGGNVLNKGF